MDISQAISRATVGAPADRASHATLRWTICRCVLASILLIAAVLKAEELATLPLLGPGLLNQRWLLVGMVEIEVVLGGWLLLGATGRWTWATTLVLWLAFLGVAGCEGLTGAGSCGCFGRVHVNPWYTASFDLTVVLALPFCRPGRTTLAVGTRRTGLLRWVAISLLAIAGAGFGSWDLYRYSRARLSNDGLTFADDLVVLEPKKWIGHPFALANYIDIGPQLASGDWIVLLYRYDCEHCQRAIPRYTALADRSVATPHGHTTIALVEVPPFAPAGQELVQSYMPALAGRLAADHDWFASTPVALRLHDGKVVVTAESDAAEDPAALRTNSLDVR
jgi:hypothetical protein